MNRCDLCGLRRPTKPFLVASGHSIGETCSDDCGALLWESHFERHADAPAHEKALTRWRISKRIAEANGRPFTEPAPKSPSEIEAENQIALHEWSDVARELA